MYEKSKSMLSQVPKVLNENRYCDQEGFSILVCGGKDNNGKITNKVLELKIPSFKVKKIPSLVKKHFYLVYATIKFNVIAIDIRKINLNESPDNVEVLFEKINHRIITMSKLMKDIVFVLVHS